MPSPTTIASSPARSARMPPALRSSPPTETSRSFGHLRDMSVPAAGSLLLADAVSTDRDTLLRAVLRSLAQWYGDWVRADGDPEASGLQAAYTAGCATLGRRVRADLPGERMLEGEAVALDGDGRLVVATEGGGTEAVGAGDIVHLRTPA